MRILIADDEAPARERLKALLADLGVAGLIVEAGNGLEALRGCLRERPDAVLLDIRMPAMDGIECARELARLPQPPAVIFTTAYDDYALDAFDVAACDYLLKPVRRERLAAALGRAQRFGYAHWERLQRASTAEAVARDRLCAYLHGDVRLIPVRDVLFFRAEQKYTTVRTVDGETVIDDSLKSLEDEFKDGFFRAHRNALVAFAHIEQLEKAASGGGQLKLRGIAERLEVSRRHLPDVRARLKALGKAE